MNLMKKEIIYLLEYLSKSDKAEEAHFYQKIISALENALLYTPTRYTQNQLQTLIKHSGYTVPQNFQEALNRLDTVLENALPKNLIELRKSIFLTLLVSNFPKKKGFLEHSLALFESQLEPVEKSIYHNLSAYVISLNRGLALLFLLQSKSTPEMLVTFAKTLHVTLLETIFNQEERALLSQGLSELMAVYVGVYGKFLYMEAKS